MGARIILAIMLPARPTLKKIFAATLREAGDEAPVLAWSLVCGNKIAGQTRARSFMAGVLAVEVPDATWQNQLRSLAHRYVSTINEISPVKVKGIDFVITPNIVGTSNPAALQH